MTLVHINVPRHEPLYDEAAKLSIPECRKILKAAGYQLEKREWGWRFVHDLKHCAICQPYYDPLPIRLTSSCFGKRDIQDFAYMMRQEADRDK